MKLSEYIEGRLQVGAITFSKNDAMNALGISDLAFMRAAQRLQKKTHLIRPFAGFYVIVEVGYRVAGGPEPIYFIGKLMSYLDLPYYVGLLSAAKYHGATHQGVFETQVLTTRPLPSVTYGKHRIRFITNKYAASIPKQALQTPHGDIWISTPESTLFDLVRYQKHAAGFSHIATTILEMKEKIRSHKLSAIADIYNDTPLIQRVGYLLEKFHHEKTAMALLPWLKKRGYGMVKLEPSMRGSSQRDTHWQVNINTSIEPDDV